MRRLALVAVVLAVPALPLLTMSPAFAADNVICVNIVDPSCTPGQSVATIPLAISAANVNALPDTILVGPGTYSDGPYVLNGNAHALTLKGAGPSTIVTLPATAGIQTYIQAGKAAVQDLAILLAPESAAIAGNDSNDTGLGLFSSATADHVAVTGDLTQNATGIQLSNSQLSHSSSLLPATSLASSRSVYGQGGNTITDTVISGYVGFVQSASTPDSLSRVSITASSSGVSLDGGTINIDDSVIDLGTNAGAVGLMALNQNNAPSPKTINADHVTIVGGGAGSKGAWAYAADPGLQHSAITLTNSIIRGPATSLQADAGNAGPPLAKSDATITISYSDYATTGGTVNPASGTGGVVLGLGNVVNVDPAFVSPTDHHLTVASPLIDKGNPAAGGPTLDRDGLARVIDGDGNGIAIRDMGAYERPVVVVPDTTAPETTIVAGPTGVTTDATPTFAFISEAGATFECRVDAASYAACSGPGATHTTAVLTDGAHTFSVRAKDAAANLDPSPATRSFMVDTTAPDTTITKKPKHKITKGKAKFVFSSPEAGTHFECKVDQGAYLPCTSPLKLKVKVGKHTVSVRAVDAIGNADPTPATCTFKRIRKS